MWSEYIGFDDLSKKTNILNDDYDIIGSYSIGECLVDYINIDFSRFEIFYDDMRKVLFPQHEDDYLITSDKLKEKNVKYFFSKYTVLKKFLLDKTMDIYKVAEISEKDLEMRINSRTFFNYMSWDFIFACYVTQTFIENIDEIRSHPFISLAYDTDPEDSFLKDNYYHIIKNRFYETFVFCFDVEFNNNLNSLTANERYYLYNQLNIPGMSYSDTSTLYVNITKKLDSITKYNAKNNDLSHWIDENINEDVIKTIKSKNVKLTQLFETHKVEDMLYAEFIKMISLDIKVMKCKNCGKYFVLKGGYNTKYCDRIPAGEKYTCQKLATLKNQKEKLDNNPVLKEYQKAYKRKYAQVSNKKLDQEVFRLWVEEATLKRDITSEQYNNNLDNQILLEFKKYLGNK